MWERVGCGVVVGLGNYEVRAELTGFRTGDPQDNGLGRAAVRLRHQAVRPYPEFQPRIPPVRDIRPPFLRFINPRNRRAKQSRILKCCFYKAVDWPGRARTKAPNACHIFFGFLSSIRKEALTNCPVISKRRRFKLRCRAIKNLYACPYAMTVSDSMAVRGPVWAFSESKSM